MLLMTFYMFSNRNIADEKYSAIVNEFKQLKVSEFQLDLGNGQLKYKLRTDTKETPSHTYLVPDIQIFWNDVKDYFDEYDAKYPSQPMVYTYVRSANWGSILLNYLPTLLLIGAVVVFYFMMSQQGGGGKLGNIGKAKTKTVQDEGRRSTFEDVAGADEEKEELQEIVEYLKNPSRFNSLGAKIPTGVLLVGPPGTGKTLLARAVAGEAGVPFYSISGSNFVELYVGVGASRVRDLFEKAKKNRPSIIFIDEIDAVGRQRGAGLGGGNDEREQTLNQLLVEMDGFTGNEGVIVMAATNRADILDHALLRPGRFDRTIYVGYPDIKGREEILKVHSRGKPMGPDVDLVKIAKTTPGFTGADLENLINEAALLAARKGQKAITESDIEEASIKVVAGPEKRSKVVTEKERRVAAYHEAGHAISIYVATPEKPVHQISIIPRGQMGGYTMWLPDDDTMLHTKGDMEKEIITLLGGRVTEQLVFDDISTGASNDLERATTIARSMVTQYGFSEKLGPIVYGGHDEVFLGRDFTQSRSYSEQIANEIDTEIRAIVETNYDKCKKILIDHMGKLEIVAKMLLKFEKMDGVQFAAIMTSDDPEALPEVQSALFTVEDAPLLDSPDEEAAGSVQTAVSDASSSTVDTKTDPTASDEK
ncbi:MAG: ATP-dependent zinc metalloprotease FtsH [Oscillospiraceae bacterium]